uniref:Chitin-binding type-2 domain-containing protein n=1 Tax=Ditylenchus dipsaci TaxID=166011 RepID=A0A915E5Z4_9BILA
MVKWRKALFWALVSLVELCCLISAVTTTVDSTHRTKDPFTCVGRVNGYYEAQICSNFYFECLGGRLFKHPCGQGLAYSPKKIYVLQKPSASRKKVIDRAQSYLRFTYRSSDVDALGSDDDLAPVSPLVQQPDANNSPPRQVESGYNTTSADPPKPFFLNCSKNVDGVLVYEDCGEIRQNSYHRKAYDTKYMGLTEKVPFLSLCHCRWREFPNYQPIAFLSIVTKLKTGRCTGTFITQLEVFSNGECTGWAWDGCKTGRTMKAEEIVSLYLPDGSRKAQDWALVEHRSTQHYMCTARTTYILPDIVRVAGFSAPRLKETGLSTNKKDQDPVCTSLYLFCGLSMGEQNAHIVVGDSGGPAYYEVRKIFSSCLE